MTLALLVIEVGVYYEDCICAIKTTKIEMDSRAPGARQKVPFKHPIFIVGGAPRKRGYSYTNFCGVCCCC
jgi:hypothetical protein